MPSTIFIACNYFHCNFSLIAVVQAFPKTFAKECMPKETRDVSLSDSQGTKWTMKWVYKDGGAASGLSTGWRGFAAAHGLGEGDVCVFELVNGNNFDLLVHVFKVGQPEEDLGVYRPTPHKSVKGGSDQQRLGSKRKRTQETQETQETGDTGDTSGNVPEDSTDKTRPVVTLDEDVG